MLKAFRSLLAVLAGFVLGVMTSGANAAAPPPGVHCEDAIATAIVSPAVDFGQQLPAAFDQVVIVAAITDTGQIVAVLDTGQAAATARDSPAAFDLSVAIAAFGAADPMLVGRSPISGFTIEARVAPLLDTGQVLFANANAKVEQHAVLTAGNPRDSPAVSII